MRVIVSGGYAPISEMGMLWSVNSDGAIQAALLTGIFFPRSAASAESESESECEASPPRK